MKLVETLNGREKAFISQFIDELDKKDYIDWDKTDDSIYIVDDALETFKREYRKKIPVEFIDTFSRCVHPLTWEKLSENIMEGKDCWNFWPDTITKITIPAGVRYIPDMAFCGDHNLTTITLPDSVQLLGDGAFADSGLKAISVPANVITVDDYCFEECAQLESVIFSKGARLLEIAHGVFRGCTALKSITVPEKVWIIHYGAFMGCDALTSVNLPKCYIAPRPKDKGIVQEGAFEDCPNLTTLRAGNSGLGDTWQFEENSLCDCPKLIIDVNNERDAEQFWRAGCHNVILRGKPYSLNESLDIPAGKGTESKVDEITDFIEDLYDLRKSSIAADGEYGLGNLVFKEMRALGYLDNLRNLKNEIVDKNLSLESLCENFSVDNLSEQ
jgi:hypothetical protein